LEANNRVALAGRLGVNDRVGRERGHNQNPRPRPPPPPPRPNPGKNGGAVFVFGACVDCVLSPITTMSPALTSPEMTSVPEPSVIPNRTFLDCGFCCASRTNTTPGRCRTRFGAENLIFCVGSHI